MPAGGRERSGVLVSRRRAGSATRRGAAALAVLALACGLGVVLPGGALVAVPARAAEGVDCLGVDEEAEATEVEGPNAPLDLLQIPRTHAWLQARGAGLGDGVDVVVVDNGFADATSSVDARGGRGEPELANAHGTVVQGLLRGAPLRERGTEPTPVGVAPDASVHSVRVYDAPDDGDDDADFVSPDGDLLGAALTQVADGIRGPEYGARTIVVVPFAIGAAEAASSRVAAGVRAVVRAGGLVVGSAGDRPVIDDGTALGGHAVEDGESAPSPGEDAGGDAYPAAVGDVLAVGVDPASGEGRSVRDVVLPNSDTDIAAPAGDGLSYGRNGEPCVVTGYSTDWAAATLAGVAALVWSYYDDQDADSIRTRLEQTADGNGARTGSFTGFGVVQPLAALQRRPGAWAEPAAAGGEEEARRAPAPVKPADVLAETRRKAVWWGVVGGGLLVVALILRPVLARRRAR